MLGHWLGFGIGFEFFLYFFNTIFIFTAASTNRACTSECIMGVFVGGAQESSRNAKSEIDVNIPYLRPIKTLF